MSPRLAVLLLLVALAGCQSAPETNQRTSKLEKRLSTPEERMKAGLEGQIRPVRIESDDGIEYELFLLTATEVYHLTFDPKCQISGGDDSLADGDGLPKMIGGKAFLLHSSGRYRISGEPNLKGLVLSTRPTIPIRVTKFDVAVPGAGTSYLDNGWRKGRARWAPPQSAHGSEDSIFVNDSSISVRLEKNTIVIGGTKVININSVAPWAQATQ